MKIITSLIILFITLNLAKADDFLDYNIPEKSDKYGPIYTRNQSITYFKYFVKGSDFSDKSKLVGVEKFKDNTLVEKKLYLNGSLHGIQREWFGDKTLRSEIPYENGKLNGRCRHWGENGNLVGSYMIKNGVGDVLLFQENGSLSKSENFRNNKKNGWVVEYHDNGRIRVVNKILKGDFIFDYSAAFYDTGSIRFMTLNSRDSKKKNGFIVFFTPSGKFLEKAFYLNGESVSEKKYIEEGVNNSRNPTLPSDPKKCLNLFNNEVKKIVEEYSDLEKVKIPLKFDEYGEIETVSGKPFSLPSY